MTKKKNTAQDIVSIFLDYDKNYSDQISIKQYLEKINLINEDLIVINYTRLISMFNEITGKRARVIDSKTKKNVSDRLSEGFTKQDIKNAIINCYNDQYHKENNHKYLTLEFITRPEILQRFSSMKVQPNSDKNTQERSRELIEKEKNQWA